MTDATSNSLDSRYAELAAALKSYWVFERFFNRLCRSQARAELEVPELDLTTTLSRLRSVAEDMDSADEGDLVARLERVETDLRHSAGSLRAQDSRIGAADVRRFLTRVRRPDEEILLEILRFYMLSSRGAEWGADLVDKVDFLLSRLGQELCGPLLTRERERFESSVGRLGGNVAGESVQPSVVGSMRERVEEISTKMGAVRTLDELEQLELIPEYRRLKHDMGRLLVEPAIAIAVLDTNAHLGRTLQRLFGDEEWRIAVELLRIAEFEGEGGASEALRSELASLQHDFERFGKGRRFEGVRVEEVQRIRRQVQDLSPGPAGIGSHQASITPEDPSRRSASDLAWELFMRLYTQLETLLAASGSIDEVEDVLQDPGLPFGLERREVAAFVWMRDNLGSQSAVDRLVLTGAALRLRLKTLRDRLEAGLGDEGEQLAAEALALAEDVMDDFGDQMSAAEESGDSDLAADARFLRVLLMRDYVTLWLELRGGS